MKFKTFSSLVRLINKLINKMKDPSRYPRSNVLPELDLHVAAETIIKA